MASIDLITASFKAAWTATTLVPTAEIYYARPQKPPQLAGFPYIALIVELETYEVRTGNPSGTAPNNLATYRLTVEVWTCQGQTGGATTGLQITDQGNIMRATEAILNNLTPNVPWESVTNFLHCIRGDTMECKPDEELYLGKDVLKSSQDWQILVAE